MIVALMHALQSQIKEASDRNTAPRSVSARSLRFLLESGSSALVSPYKQYFKRIAVVSDGTVVNIVETIIFFY